MPATMSQLFQRKSIGSIEQRPEGESLRRVMGPGDLIMLSMGAVNGARLIY